MNTYRNPVLVTRPVAYTSCPGTKHVRPCSTAAFCRSRFAAAGRAPPPIAPKPAARCAAARHRSPVTRITRRPSPGDGPGQRDGLCRRRRKGRADVQQHDHAGAEWGGGSCKGPRKGHVAGSCSRVARMRATQLRPLPLSPRLLPPPPPTTGLQEPGAHSVALQHTAAALGLPPRRLGCHHPSRRDGALGAGAWGVGRWSRLMSAVRPADRGAVTLRDATVRGRC